jgi:hypothetical protein
VSVTVMTAAKIAELVGKHPGLGIDTFVHERDYNQAENSRKALEDELNRLRPRVASCEFSDDGAHECNHCDIKYSAARSQSDAGADYGA